MHRPAPAVVPIFTVSYEGVALRSFVAALASFSLVRPTALLCYEADFNRCHRSYVARAVARRTGANVHHITTSGVITDAAGASDVAG